MLTILRYRNFNKQKTGQAKRAVICRQTETGQAKRAVILHTESAKRWGGQERRTFAEAVEFKKRGYRVILAVQPESALGKQAKEVGIEVREIGMENREILRAFFRLFSLMRRERVDIVNTHSPKDSWIASFAARLACRPIILRTRHISVPISNHLLNIVYKLPHKIITCGEKIRERMIEVNRFPKEKVISIPTGVDVERFNPERVKENIREELGIDQDAPLVGSISIIRTEKGYPYFLEAAQEILKVKPETRFLIVGHEPKGDTLAQEVRRRGLEDKVIMPGSREDVPEILASLDVFVLSSLREGVPQGVAQALAMERPVVATDVGGVPELVKDNETGLLVPPADSRALAKAILELLKDRKKAKRLGRNGRRLVKERFSQKVMIAKIENIYQELLKV
ncbi:glycosyltransferase family 4 protein [bacterium]|nr:glycosyltransferase family 4 protein [bacterium]